MDSFTLLDSLPTKRRDRALKLLRRLRSPACQDIRFAAVAAEDLEDAGLLHMEYRITTKGAQARLRLREGSPA